MWDDPRLQRRVNLTHFEAFLSIICIGSLWLINVGVPNDAFNLQSSEKLCLRLIFSEN